jgi:4-hydroxy-tetrahydrodipicolinate synthase
MGSRCWTAPLDEVRLPLTGLEDTTKQKIQAAMRHAGLLN